MEPLSSAARGKVMVHEGEKRRKSRVRAADGTKWNPRSKAGGGVLVLGKGDFLKSGKGGIGMVTRRVIGERVTGHESELRPFRDDKVFVNLRTRNGQFFSNPANFATTERFEELTDLIPQYKMLIRTSMGVTHTDKVFLSRNNRFDCVRSASEPSTNVAVAMDSPMMVRYWKCHPYEALLGVGKEEQSERGVSHLARKGWREKARLHWGGKIYEAK